MGETRLEVGPGISIQPKRELPLPLLPAWGAVIRVPFCLLARRGPLPPRVRQRPACGLQPLLSELRHQQLLVEHGSRTNLPALRPLLRWRRKQAKRGCGGCLLPCCCSCPCRRWRRRCICLRVQFQPLLIGSCLESWQVQGSWKWRGGGRWWQQGHALHAALLPRQRVRQRGLVGCLRQC